jgi:hypothetical protein
MNIFRILILAGAVAMIAAPATAKHVKRHHHHDWHAAANQPPHPRWHPNAGGVPYIPGAYRPPNTGPYAGRDPYGVYFGNQEVSRDPDPNVRQELIYDYSYLYSW